MCDSIHYAIIDLGSSTARIEPRPDLCRGAARILAMREMANARKWRKVQVRKVVGQPVRPGDRQDRVPLPPAHTGRRVDRGRPRKLFPDGLQALRVGAEVPVEAALQVPRFEKI